MTTTEHDHTRDVACAFCFSDGYAAAKHFFGRTIVRLRAEVNEQTIRAEKAEAQVKS